MTLQDLAALAVAARIYLAVWVDILKERLRR